MWWAQPKQAASAKMAVIYITVGALVDVWTVIYYIYLNNNGADFNAYLWCYGFFFTGLVLMFVGFSVGWIGRQAKGAEVAPVPPQIVAAAGMAPAVAPALAPTVAAPVAHATAPVPATDVSQQVHQAAHR